MCRVGRYTLAHLHAGSAPVSCSHSRETSHEGHPTGTSPVHWMERSPILHLGMSERLNTEYMMLNGLFIITIMCQFLHDELALYL